MRFKWICGVLVLLTGIIALCFPSLNNNYHAYGLNESSKIKLDPKKPTVFHIHGWRQNVDDPQTPLKIVNSFLKRNQHNVCVLDYKDLALKFYTMLVDNAPLLSEKVAVVLQKWIKNGVDPRLIHLVGQSLGAHICGLIGRNLLGAGYVLGRITGLDPANPPYCTNGSTPHPNALSKGDAGFVDVIHTDSGLAGCLLPLGVADFYPNKGTRTQPMCGNGFMEFMSMFTGVQWGLMIWLPINLLNAAVCTCLI